MPGYSAEQLKGMRKKTGLSQEDLGKLIGLSKRRIGSIERNEDGAADKMTLEKCTEWIDVCVANMREEYRSDTLTNWIKSIVSKKHLKYLFKQ